MLENVNKKKITLVDVAKKAGVSTAAASKALQGSSGKTIKVSPETVERIKKAAEELRYVPNSIARNLATQRAGCIGYILSESIHEGFNNSYFNRYLAGVEEGCRKNGYGLYIARAQLSDIKNIILPDKMKQQSVDGIIATGTISDEVAAEMHKYSVPVIFLNRYFDYEKLLPTFCADAVDGLKKAMEYAISMNHRKMWFCRGFSGGEYDKFMKKFNPVCETISKNFSGFQMITTDFLNNLPYNEELFAERLLEEWQKAPDKEHPSIVIGDSKIITLFLGKLASVGVRCPEDVSAISYADLDMNRFCYPALTAVDYDFERIGSDSVSLMIEYIEKKKSIPPEKYRNDYPARLIERNSVRRIEK